MTFAQRRIRLTTHFSERVPFVKRRISVYVVAGDLPSYGLQTSSDGSLKPTFGFNLSDAIFKGLELLEASRRYPISLPETSVRDHQHTLLEIPQDRSYHIYR